MTDRRQRVLICGSRGWINRGAVTDQIDLYDKKRVTIIHGDAPNSPDRIAGNHAENQGYKVEAWPADWERFGRRAGPIRNIAMLNTLDHSEGDHVIAFWDGMSRGTKHTIDEARKRGIRVTIVSPVI